MYYIPGGTDCCEDCPLHSLADKKCDFKFHFNQALATRTSKLHLVFSYIDAFSPPKPSLASVCTGLFFNTSHASCKIKGGLIRGCCSSTGIDAGVCPR